MDEENKKNINSKRIENAYKIFKDKMSSLKRRQGVIINNFLRKTELEKIEKIRHRLYKKK